jgi:hypothetical protein
MPLRNEGSIPPFFVLRADLRASGSQAAIGIIVSDFLVQPLFFSILAKIVDIFQNMEKYECQG